MWCRQSVHSVNLSNATHADKPKSSDMQTERTKPLLENFALLFYICKILGLNSQDWRHFRCYKQFKKSTTGECIVVAGIIFTFANFNAMIFTFNSQSYFAEKGKKKMQFLRF